MADQRLARTELAPLEDRREPLDGGGRQPAHRRVLDERDVARLRPQLARELAAAQDHVLGPLEGEVQLAVPRRGRQPAIAEQLVDGVEGRLMGPGPGPRHRRAAHAEPGDQVGQQGRHGRVDAG